MVPDKPIGIYTAVRNVQVSQFTLFPHAVMSLLIILLISLILAGSYFFSVDNLTVLGSVVIDIMLMPRK